MKNTYDPRHIRFENDDRNADYNDHYDIRPARKPRRQHVVLPWILTGLFALAAIGGATVFGLSVINNVNSGAQAVQPTAAVKLIDRADSETIQTAVQNDTQSSSNAAPAQNSGTHHSGAYPNGSEALHVFANGKTTEGYNWRYEGGGGLVAVGVDYTFATQSYDFSLIGQAPGSGTITLFYNVDDNTQAPLTVSFTVDQNLNVSYQ